MLACVVAANPNSGILGCKSLASTDAATASVVDVAAAAIVAAASVAIAIGAAANC